MAISVHQTIFVRPFQTDPFHKTDRKKIAPGLVGILLRSPIVQIAFAKSRKQRRGVSLWPDLCAAGSSYCSLRAYLRSG